jgi:hypothetical protein
MILFDAAERSVCSVQCSTSNTPSQALVLLNDPCFVEPSIALALGAANQEVDDDQAIRYLFRQLLIRQPDESELRILRELHQQAMSTWTESEAVAFLRTSASNMKLRLDGQDIHPSHQLDHLQPKRIGGLVAVVQVILSMNETLTVN